MNETQQQLLKRYKARERFWAVLGAWMAGQISEGQACTLCGITPVDLRECAEEQKAVADALWERYREDGDTIDNDIRDEAGTAQFHRQRLSD